MKQWFKKIYNKHATLILSVLIILMLVALLAPSPLKVPVTLITEKATIRFQDGTTQTFDVIKTDKHDSYADISVWYENDKATFTVAYENFTLIRQEEKLD